jgi:DNA-binding CsgD family transcriptional regulator
VTTATPSRPLLSDADRQLVEMVAEGDPDKRIAHRLGRSRTAVTTRIRQLMAETGTQTRAHLVAVTLYGQADPRAWSDTPQEVAQRRALLLAELRARDTRPAGNRAAWQRRTAAVRALGEAEGSGR